MIKEKQYTPERMKEDILKFTEYVDKVKETGVLNVFAELFQVDYRILDYLQGHPDAHPSIVADVLKVSRPNIAANLRLLGSKGYILRNIDGKNRRQIFVNITEKGIRYLNIVNNQCMRLFASWFNILGEEEVRHLFNILELSTDLSKISDDIYNTNFGLKE